MIIREANPEDIPALLDLEQSVIEAEKPFNSSIKAEKTHYYDLDNLIASKDSYLVVVEDSSDIVATGYVQIRESKTALKHDTHSYLGFMFVSPEHRGKAINQKVMSHLIEWSKSRGITDLYLDVYSQNESAIKAYEKAGFEPSLMEMKLGI
ncbi:MAG: GNAT family N-acetyltransferase [Bermanella sp.]